MACLPLGSSLRDHPSMQGTCSYAQQHNHKFSAAWVTVRFTVQASACQALGCEPFWPVG